MARTGLAPEAVLEWAAAGDAVLRKTAASAAADGGLRRPSALPDWTMAHVVAHVARNADALVNLLTWARTGIKTPMYASLDARAEQIEADSRRPDDEQLADLNAAAGRFRAAAAAASEAQCWEAMLSYATGEPVPASGIPWMRTRETWVHATDLGAGLTFADIPLHITEAFIDDAAEQFAGRDGVPAVALRAADSGRSWTLGPAGAAPAEVTGDTASLAAYLTGRAVPRPLRTAGGALPGLPPWR